MLRPCQFWGIDMTKFLFPALGWAYLVVALDWFSRKVVGWRLSLRCRTQEWREALEAAVLQEFPNGVRGQGLKLISVWIDFYNQRYLHSALGYKSPMEYEQLYQEEDLGKAA